MLHEDYKVILIKFLVEKLCNDVGKKWTLQMLIPRYLVLVLKLSPIYTVSLNTVFSIPQNQCYLGTPYNMKILGRIDSVLSVFYFVK